MDSNSAVCRAIAYDSERSEESRMRSLAMTQHDETTDLHHDRCWQTMACLIFLSAIVVAANVSAQTEAAKEKDKLEPRTVKLNTKDDVELRAAYFPSDKGKDAIPVLLIHEWKGQASPYFELSKKLQANGSAVLVPEYRGHGGSRDYVDSRGQTKRFDVARMNKRDIEKIVAMDLESCKGFLKEENNEGKLNLNALVVIAVGEGAIFAGHWALHDWNFPSIGRKKQGQDVKALIYISPEKQIKGIGIDSTLSDPHLIQLPIMIVAGKGSSEAEEATRIAKQVEGMKKRIGRGAATGFNLLMPDTSLSGPRLVNDVSEVSTAIIEFVSNEVEVSETENPWINRL